MTADAVRRVEISNLSLGPVLGSGGQGRVIAVENYLIDDKWPAALKTYSTGVNPDARGLDEIVAFPDQLHRNNRDWLMGISSWPWAVAMDNGAVCGFLMRVVPEIYRFNFMTVTQGSKAKLSTVEFLLNPDDYIKRSGISISEKDRLNLLGALAEAMSRLHSLGIVVGDVSPKNLLFNLNSYASCFIIDCDAVALHGQSALNQVDTPGWEVPPGEEKGTEASDSYKFGLLAIRLFARDQDSQDASAISALSPELGRLAALSQGDNALSRPAPGSWVSAIQSAASSASSAYASQAFTARQPARASAQAPQYGAQNLSQPPYGPVAGIRPYPAPSPRSRGRGGKILGLAGAALVALVAIIIGVNASNNNAASNFSQTGNSAGSSGGSVSDAPSSQPASSAPPASVGNVNIGDSVSGNSAASAVAGMFNTYFTGINNQDYQQALSVFDPNGVINPNDSSQVQQFANGVSTTSDSGIMLINISPSGGSPVQSSEVQFTSHQQAGYGPKDDPNGTCTSWDVTYTLSQGSSGNYLISNVSGSTDSAC